MTSKPDVVREAVMAAMQARGMTQTALAAAADVPQPNLSAWLGGKSTITTVTASRILGTLGLRVALSERKVAPAAGLLDATGRPIEHKPRLKISE